MSSIFEWSPKFPSVTVRFIVAIALSAGLMYVDHRTRQLQHIRAWLDEAAQPIYRALSAPWHLGPGIIEFFETRDRLRAENRALDTALSDSRIKLIRYDALARENERLRALLGARDRVSGRALAAEILEVGSETFNRRIVIARGSADLAYTGQPVIDADGIVGQITRVASRTAHVTLVTDSNHAVPVLVERNGLRALAYGTGNPDTLELPFLTAATDIRKGDRLVSSGLGGIFPDGYPVGEVIRVVNDPGEAYLTVIARPAARLKHDTRVLLLWPTKGQGG